MTIGVLCIHGFTGSPHEVQPLMTFLQQEKPQWLYEVMTLSGHGEELKLKGIKAKHWFKDVENTYRQLAAQVDEVIVIGFSMGGVLALYLALRYKVSKLILLSPAIKYIDLKQLFSSTKELIVNRKNLREEQSLFITATKKQMPHINLITFSQFRHVLAEVTPYLSKITEPTLIVQGEKDAVVPKESATTLYNQISSRNKQLYFSKEGYHHICYSEDHLTWFQLLLNFIEER